MIIESEQFIKGWDEYDFHLTTAFNADRAYEALREEGFMASLSGGESTVTIAVPHEKARAIVRARLIIEALQ